MEVCRGRNSWGPAVRSAEGRRKACRGDEVVSGALCTGGVGSRYLGTPSLAAEGEMHQRGHGRQARGDCREAGAGRQASGL